MTNTKEEKLFPNGLIFKQKEGRPDFVVGSIAISCKDFVDTMKEHEKKGWLNIDLKISKDGNPYAEIDTWEPKQTQAKETKKTLDW